MIETLGVILTLIICVPLIIIGPIALVVYILNKVADFIDKKRLKMTKVINLFAGAGSGKSTTAAGLFFLMKIHGYKVELVTEYAKELCYEGRLGEAQQMSILGEQYNRQNRLVGKVDYIITDSPLLLNAVYDDDETVIYSAKQLFKRFDNVNFFINRVKPFANYGRLGDLESNKAVDLRIKSLLVDYQVEANVDGDINAPKTIFNILGLKR